MNIKEKYRASESGLLTLPVIILLTGVMLSLALYSKLTLDHAVGSGLSRQSESAFYGAEGGLNNRIEKARDLFKLSILPSGTPPIENGTECQGGNMGSGDFACVEFSTEFAPHKVMTYLTETPGNPQQSKVPAGEAFAGLSATEWRYRAVSRAINQQGQTQALLETIFKYRNIPLFQFATFFDKDLEITPGPDMTINGPVHSNGDLYLSTLNSLNFLGQITTSGVLYRGLKIADLNLGGTVSALNPGTLQPLPSSSNTSILSNTDLLPWNGNIRTEIDQLVLPSDGEFDPQPGKKYWESADIRIALYTDPITGDPVSINVVDSTRAPLTGPTNTLNTNSACRSSLSKLVDNRAVHFSTSFFDRRENGNLIMIEVDLGTLLKCVQESKDSGTPILSGGKDLTDITDDGLVFYFTIIGLNELAQPSYYGVRIRGAKELKKYGTPGVIPRGLTIISDQPLFTQGDFNSPSDPTEKIPAALIGDTVNILSNSWPDNDLWSDSAYDISTRIAAPTNVNAAILAGSSSSGGGEGAYYQFDGYGTSSGGLQNFPRFHENWIGKDFNYSGSMVSLGQPQRANGPFSVGTVYQPPNRNWQFEVSFLNSLKLPPLTPKFSTTKQEQFFRNFSLK